MKAQTKPKMKMTTPIPPSITTPTGSRRASARSISGTANKNADGGATVWFGPTPPAAEEGNWVQTVPGKSWNVILRLYAPLQPWFDKSWKPRDFERID
jgi:hypothetical protein